jgi:uncharacterized coiled-coil protein SlyX
MNAPNASPAPEDDDAAANRLTRIEEQVAYQQQMLDAFHDVLLRRETELAELRREVTQCRDAIERLLAGGGENLPYDKPPHY